MRISFDPRALTIRSQLVLGMIVCLATIGAIFVVVIPSMEADILRRSESVRLNALAETAARFVFPGLDFRDEAFVGETTRLLFAQPEIYRVQVFDADGQLFSEERDLGEQVDPSRLHRVSVPVQDGGESLGELVLITRTDSLESTVASMRFLVICVALATLGLGVTVAFVLGGYISRPVVQLQAATSAIAEGSLQVKVPVGTRNELGDLAHDFNLMVDALSRTTTSRDLLEHEVREREKALTEVRKLKEKAEQASRSKSEFLANMSHEIRTPMNAIIGLTDLTLEGDLEAEAREHLETVLRSSQHLLGIINDVLDLSKIEAGKLELYLEPTDLAELVSDVALQQAVVAENRELCVYASIDEHCPRWVEADALRLRQILTNLVGNAIKFTSRGFITLRVTGFADDRGSKWIRAQVEDTGIGIAPDKKEQIFRPFEQADGSTTRNYGGTGLGLSITTRLVRKMGGRLELDSEPGQGSLFTIEIPAPEAPAVSREFDALAGTQVFLAVEDPRAREFLHSTLGFWGLEIVSEAGTADLLLEEAHTSLSPDHSWSLGQRIDVLNRTAQGFDDSGMNLALPFAPVAMARTLTSALGLSDPSRKARPRQSPQAQPSLQPGGAGLKVLLAEDNATNQKVATRFLEKMGFVVDVVENGRDAVRLALETEYAFVLMDWHMPEMNGLESTREIRRQERRRRIPIVGLTANALPGDRETCLKAGMDGYISKPIQRQEFEKLIRELIENGGGETNPRAA